MSTSRDITGMLHQLSGGDRNAFDELLPLVYDELRALADWCLRGERNDHTLEAAALVHEAYLRLVGQEQVEWRNRAHFFAVAAQAIRRVLVDHARRRHRAKRGGDRCRVPLDEALVVTGDQDFDMVALDEALTRLTAHAKRKARVVEMRFFGGLKLEEVAVVLGVTSRTVGEDWRYARAWLFRELTDTGCEAKAEG